MARLSKITVAPVAVIVCIVLLAGRFVGPAANAQAERAKSTEEQQQDVCVLVEAFVVEVNLSQLYEQGVSPIGQKPNSVSVENILKCLNVKDIAQVTTGLKVAVNSGQHGEAKVKQTIRIERQLNVPSTRNVPPNVRYANYDAGKTLRATAIVRPGGEILVSFDFNESTYRNITNASELPPNSVSREWAGVTRLVAGRPAIAGAAQDEETAVFLILSADVTDR
jgi:hypothetical protein